MTTSFLLAYFLLFTYLTSRRLIYGLLLISVLLPTYLIRFQIAGIPMTLLEGMILILVLTWIIKHRRDWNGTVKHVLRADTLPRPFTAWFIATILFLIAATISIFVAHDTKTALGIWKAYFVEPILLFSVFISTVKSREDLNKIIWALILGAIPVALLGVIQKFTGWFIYTPYWFAPATRRVTSVFGYPNAVALYLAPLVPMCLYLIKQYFICRLSREVKPTVQLAELAEGDTCPPLAGALPYRSEHGVITRLIPYSLFLIPLAFALAIIFAKSVGALVALVGTAGIFGLVWKKTRHHTKIFGVVVVIGILIIVLTPLKKPFQEEILFSGISGQIRLNMWAETVEMLKTRPILGAGLSSYQAAVAPYHILKWVELYMYPHNIFLNFWTETGLLGLVSFLWLVALYIKEGSRRFASSSLIPYLLAVMIIILIHGLVDVPYFKNDLAVMFWMLIGMMAVEIKFYRRD